MPGYEYDVIYAWDYKRDSFGRKLIDNNGFAQKGTSRKMGFINPDWIGGLLNRFTFKNITL